MRLELRVTAWMAVLLGASAALALGLMAHLTTQSMERRWTEAGRALAQTTENTLEVSMLNDRPEDVEEAVRNVEKGDLIEAVSVYGADGKRWVGSDEQLGMTEARRNALLVSMAELRSAISSDGNVLSVFVPVPRRPECVACHPGSSNVLGAVEVRLDEQPFRAELNRSARTSLVVAGIPLLLGIVLSVSAVRRKVLRPLSELDAAVEELGAGDLSVRLPVYAAAEFGDVAATFNDMAERLEQRSIDLHETLETLRSELVGLEEVHELLTEGAGLEEVLHRVASNLGPALEASRVVVWRKGDEEPIEVAGTGPPSDARLRQAASEGRTCTSAGYLEDLPEDQPIEWVSAPARSRGEVLAVVGVGWDPPRPLNKDGRDLLWSLAGLVGIAVENAQLLVRLHDKEQSLQGLLRKTLTAQEEERRRIARELHDETSQVLSALLMNIGLLEGHAGENGSSKARVEAVKALAAEAARNLDTMLFELRPALLDELGLIPALRWYLAQMSDAWQIPISFEGSCPTRLPDAVEVTAFRIVQEAVGNVARHANASSIQVRVASSEGTLHVEIQDDGVGFDMASVGSRARTGESVGLMGMKERAELAGGSLRISSAHGRGTTVVADIPIQET